MTTVEEVRRAATEREAADLAAAQAAKHLQAARAAKREAHARFAAALVNAHATGTSLRALAATAGLAHQRVHQLVQAGSTNQQ